MAPTLEEFASADLHQVLEKLSTDEKISLLAGADWWTTVEIPRLGVPSVKCSDGPNGVRGKSHFLPTPATCIPCATALGATFDSPLLVEVGGLLARECKAKGTSLLLAPTCNIQRNPLNGRAFESFSEDPFLSGICAASYIDGLQKNHVGACIKHFVGNDMEHERFSVDVVIPERALREIYLMPFMIAQKLSKPWSYMSSYSKVNGIHVSENPRFLRTILREEWGFDGMVMSDWTGTYSSVEAIQAGLELEMPGPTKWRGSLAKSAVNSGKLKVKDINDRALSMLRYVQKCVQQDITTVRSMREPERVHKTSEDRELNRRAASNAIVLLKNDQNVLPLRNIKTLAVMGPNAKTRTVSGGGSAFLTSSYVVTPLEGITNAAEERGIRVDYEPGCIGYRYLPILDGWMRTAEGASGWTVRFYNDDPKLGGEMIGKHDLLGSRVRINDEKPAGLNEFFYITLEAYLTAPSSGTFGLGLSVASGRANLSIDGKTVVDNGIATKQTPGPSFYGLGTIEEVGKVTFVAGQTYKLEGYYTCVPVPMGDNDDGGDGQPPLMMAALRVGCAPIIDNKTAIEDAVDLAMKSDAVVAIIGTNMDIEAEASDRPDLGLPGETDELIRRLLAVRPDTVIINQSGSAVTFPWIHEATTLVQSWFGGNETGNAIADMIFGIQNPSGRMPLSFPYQIEDCTAHLNWGAESGRVTYGEGIFVGYRGYEETKRDVMFAFGEGISYSTFDWSPLVVTLTGEMLYDCSISVTNTGDMAGADVVQIYVTDPVCSYRRPKQELKGFTKVFLQPGETKEVHIPLDKQAFAFYNDAKECWVAERGEFQIKAGKSSRNIASTAALDIEVTKEWQGL